MKFEVLLEIQFFDFGFYGFEFSRSCTADEELHEKGDKMKKLLAEHSPKRA